MKSAFELVKRDKQWNLYNITTFVGWNSLEERRGHYSLVMMYKIVHGLVVVIPTTLLPASYDTRGHTSKFFVPSTRVNAFPYSYFPATIMSWNGSTTMLSLSPVHYRNSSSSSNWVQNSRPYIYYWKFTYAFMVMVSRSTTIADLIWRDERRMAQPSMDRAALSMDQLILSEGELSQQ